MEKHAQNPSLKNTLKLDPKLPKNGKNPKYVKLQCMKCGKNALKQNLPLERKNMPQKRVNYIKDLSPQNGKYTVFQKMSQKRVSP